MLKQEVTKTVKNNSLKKKVTDQSEYARDTSKPPSS